MSECASVASVIVTAPAASAKRLMALLPNLSVILSPAVELVSTESHIQALDEALAQIDTYDWLVMTSAYAVDVMASRMTIKNVPLPPHIQLAAVGESTADRMREVFKRDVVFPSDERAEGLSQLLCDRVKDSRVLFPRSESGLPILIENLRNIGADVLPVSVYDTTPIWPDRHVVDTVSHSHGVIVMTSPMQVTAWASLWPTVLTRVSSWRVVAMGPTTAEALQQIGINADIPAERRLEGVAQLVKIMISQPQRAQLK